MATRASTIPPVRSLIDRAAWKALEAHYTNIQNEHLRALFARDPERGKRFTAEAVGIFLDYSKQRIVEQTLHLLFQITAGT